MMYGLLRQVRQAIDLSTDTIGLVVFLTMFGNALLNAWDSLAGWWYSQALVVQILSALLVPFVGLVLTALLVMLLNFLLDGRVRIRYSSGRSVSQARS